MKRRDLLAASAVALSSGAGCLTGDSGGDSSDGAATVTIDDLGFNPRELEIEVGTTVTWVNENETIGGEHVVSSQPLIEAADDWEFEARLEEQGDEASHTFEREGVFTYADELRDPECVCGLVVVGDRSYDEVLPCLAAGGVC